ncbi:hypothetical protein [Dysgonomonas sp. 520]|uniref:LiaF transmembrane domain-containing protein n=1 Tax=Dysgonomonas sp. 520 TaxID=2302931 RepID=UPI0013D1D15D|nr:hypothetical protein [Dysgonomonas sp. 520]NDW09242.1 hypothetical protein [Dysgonomonas sp. 520]
MAKTSTGDRLAYGLTILIFGVLFLLDKTGVLSHIPYADRLVHVGSLFLIAGIVFLSTRAERVTGIVLTSVGVILSADLFFGWMKNYSTLIVPILLIVAGLILVLTAKK